MNIVQATRANFAALQHRPDGRRIRLHVVLERACGEFIAWDFWVLAATPAQRKAQLTRAVNRVRAMYPFETRAIDATYPPVQFRVEVIADASGQWCGNGLKFDSREAAEAYARDLSGRWTAVREWRVQEVSP